MTGVCHDSIDAVETASDPSSSAHGRCTRSLDRTVVVTKGPCIDPTELKRPTGQDPLAFSGCRWSLSQGLVAKRQRHERRAKTLLEAPCASFDMA
jgi:hypothetical protein